MTSSTLCRFLVDNKEIHVHKSILKIRCEHFRSMFQVNRYFGNISGLRTRIRKTRLHWLDLTIGEDPKNFFIGSGFKKKSGSWPTFTWYKPWDSFSTWLGALGGGEYGGRVRGHQAFQLSRLPRFSKGKIHFLCFFFYTVSSYNLYPATPKNV